MFCWTNGEFAFIEDGPTSVVFHIPSLTFYRVYDAALKAAFTELFKAGKQSLIAHEALKEAVQSSIQPRPRPSKTATDACPKEFVIDRLVMLVTTHCNLRCRYCYAQGGNYGERPQVMPAETALEIVDYFARNFAGINAVQFFGGEPSLVPSTIAEICTYFRGLTERGVIRRMPKFSIVTNGQFGDDSGFFRILRDHSFLITYSIDGPRAIHDYLRPAGNVSSYDRVALSFDTAKSIEPLRRAIGIEATYTREHLERGITYIDLMRFFKERFSIESAHIVPVSSDGVSDLSISEHLDSYSRILQDAVGLMFQELVSASNMLSFSVALRMLRRLVEKRPYGYVCPAGGETISVSPKGDIYPCFMFTGLSEFSFGPIGQHPEALLEKIGLFRSTRGAKVKYEHCSTCWARTACSTCLGAFQRKDGRLLPAEEYCTLVRATLTAVLIGLAKVRSCPEQWDKLVRSLAGSAR